MQYIFVDFKNIMQEKKEISLAIYLKMGASWLLKR